MSTNKKITELTAISTGQIANDDVFPIVDVSESTTKKASILSLIETISGVTSLTAQSPIAADASTGDVTISLTTVPVTKGGTNATTAADARTNLGVTATGADTTYAYRANNLSDLASASTARTNLGLGSIATQASSSVSITGGSITGITDLAVADGGTGASDAATARTNLGVTATGSDTTYAYRANNLSDLVSASTARTNLGLGSIATQDASNVTITGGSITGITDIAVADGGTGASDAATARTNLGAAASGANSDITSLTGLTTALSVAQGGTGSTTLTVNNVILGNGSSAVQVVAPGTSGNVLTSDGTTWTSSSLPSSGVTTFSAGTTGFTPSTATSGAVTLAGTLSAPNGGTGQSSYTTGDILYASSSSALSKLADAATGNALISGGVGNAPSYGKIGLTTHVSGTLAATNGGTDQSSYAVGDLLYASTSSALSKLADVATGNALISGGVGVAPSYGKIGLTTHVSGTLAASNGGTGLSTYTTGDLLYASGAGTLAALADTATGNALISGGVGVAPSYGKVGLTTHISGTLAVGNGGTGATSLTANNVLLGNGTSALQVVAPGTNGNVLTSNGTTWTSAAPASSGVTTFSAGTTGFTPSTATSGAVTLAGTLALANGGTGSTTAAGARTNLGVTATGSDTTYAYRANNLSDLGSASTARTNLGLGSLATLSTINNGNWSGTALAVGNGGTGSTSAASAYDTLASTRAVAARVRYNSDTSTIASSYNVSSVTNPATGQITINFSSSLANANYSFVGMAGRSAGSGGVIVCLNGSDSAPSTSALVVRTVSDSGGNITTAYINVTCYI